MSAEYFLDTNVVVYSFDKSAPAKREKSVNLIAEGCAKVRVQSVGRWCRSFLNVALHKWKRPMSPGDAMGYMGTTLEPLCAVFPSASLWRSALSIQIQSQYCFYDSLVVASALQCGARVLYSEDLQDGRRFDELEIRNPFTE